MGKWSLGFKCPPHCPSAQAPSSLSPEARFHASSSEMPSGFLLTLPSCSISCPWIYLSASPLGRCHRLFALWLDMSVGVHRRGFPKPQPPPARAWHTQRPPPPPPSSSDHPNIWSAGRWSVCGSGWGFACECKYTCTPWVSHPHIPWLALHTWA